jgi:Sigma-70 region 2
MRPRYPQSRPPTRRLETTDMARDDSSNDSKPNLLDDLLDDDEGALTPNSGGLDGPSSFETPPSHDDVVRNDDTDEEDGPPAVAAVPAPEPISEEALRSAYRAMLGDEELFNDLHEHVVHVYRLKPNDTDDVVQTAYMRAMKANHSPTDSDKALGWLKFLAFRTYLDLSRARRRRGRAKSCTMTSTSCATPSPDTTP